MKVHLILILALLVFYTQATEYKLMSDAEPAEDNEPAGIVLTFTETFWNNLITDLLPQVFKFIDDYKFDNGTATVEIGNMLTINITNDFFKINNITYNDTLTRVDLFASNNSIGLHIGRSKFSLEWRYEVEMDPNLISDRGNLSAGYQDFSYDLIFGMEKLKGNKKYVSINVTLNDFNLEPESVKANLTNTNDFNKQMGSIANAIKPAVVNLIKGAVEEYLETGVNTAIEKIPETFTLNDFVIDVSLIDTPRVNTSDKNDNFTYSKFVGKFYPVDGNYTRNNTCDIPLYDPKGRSLQIYVSEYTIQSYLYTQYTLGNIDVYLNNSFFPQLLKFDTDTFSYFIPPLKHHYDSNKPAYLRI